MLNLPQYARAVIIGGGVIGTSIAYHLSLHPQWRDVLLLEQGSLTCGTTWHAAGLIGQMRSTSAEIELSKYGCHLLQSLEDQGYSTGWQKSGSLSLSSSPERLVHLKRNLTRAKAFDIEAELLSPDEALNKFPYFDKTDINGALWLPNDGSAISTDLTMALSQAAKQNGVKIFENTQVTGLIQSNNKVISGVKTEFGDIKADVVVICAGLWSPHISPDLTVPLQPCYHMYVITEACGIIKDLPILRDLDGLLYAREWSGGLCVGGFELNAKPCFTDGNPGKLQYHLFPEDYDQFDPIMKSALNRIPFMRTSGIRQFINGPESFTIDNAYILGEDPYIKGLYMATGFNSSGIASSGGAGLALSEWIINGKSKRDLWNIDTRRFAKFMKNRKYLEERVTETLGFHYSIPWPLREYKTGRGIRRSALYEILKQKGGFFGNKFGWERVNCFSKGDFNVSEALKSWILNEKLNELIKEEHIHTRTKVSIFDQTSFSKYLLQGKDALKACQYLFCGDLDVPIGKIIYTGMLNEEGGYEADVTITRLSNDEFFIISATNTTTRDLCWIKQILTSKEYNSTITDITSSYAILSIMGPSSRNFLQSLLEESIGNEDLKFGWSKEVGIGMARVRVNRISYVGTLGYELVISNEMTAYVYELLDEKGNEFQLKDAGYYAIDSLRIEKANKAFGVELKSDINPIEAGLSFQISWKKKEDFIGKKTLLEAKNKGIYKKIVSFTIENTGKDTFLLGDEPIYKNNELIGYVTSTKYGYSVGKWVFLAVVKRKDGKVIDNAWFNEGGFEIEVLGDRRNARFEMKGAYDPENLEVLA